MHGSRRKIPSKNLVRQRCVEGFNSGVEGLNGEIFFLTYAVPHVLFFYWTRPIKQLNFRWQVATISTLITKHFTHRRWLGTTLCLKQDMHFTYNVTSRRLPVTFAAAEKQCVKHYDSVSVSVFLRVYSCLFYPAFKSHLFCAVLRCHPCPVWLYHIFLHYLTRARIFCNNYWTLNCVLILFTTLSCFPLQEEFLMSLSSSS
jgi:hypothetical protein